MSDEGVSAGRGVVYIAAAKMYFIAVTSAVQLLLPRLLGEFVFGAYSLVGSAVSILNNVFVTGTIQAVSRYTTAEPNQAGAVKAAGLRMHLAIGLPVALLFAAGAPLWARFYRDPTKTGPLILSAGIVAAYAFYSVFVGSANGVRAFHKQAGLDIGFTTLRVGSILAAAILGLGVYGVIGAWVGAAFVILVASVFVVGLPSQGERAARRPIRPMAAFLGSLAAFLICMNFMMQTDQFFLKRFATDWFLGHGVAGAAVLADGQVGYYRAAQDLARIPYQLMLAVTFVVFPLVSRSTFEDDLEKTRSYVRTTMRYSLIFAGLMGAVLAANPVAMVDLVQKPHFAVAGGPALAPLALGHVAFAVFTIACTILNGAGRTRDAISVCAVTLGGLCVALWIAIPRFEPGPNMLFACGAATGGAMLLGALGSGWLLWRRFRAVIPPLTVVRVVLAVGACLALGRAVPARTPLMTLAMAAATAVLFLAVLAITRELGGADLDALKKIARRRP